MRIELVKDEDFPAVIDLKTSIINGSIYNETIEASIIEKPKYLSPYRMDAVLIGKKVAMTVTG